MNWIIIKNYTLVVLINLVILISILGLLEIVFRLNFEEFKNHIHSSQKTLGKNSITSNFLWIRVPNFIFSKRTNT